MNSIEMVNQELSPLIQKIKQHELYAHIRSLADLRVFMEYHVFAVWDFMCLLKELHRKIVTTRAPWFPPKDAFSAYLIGRIMLEEETDRTQNRTQDTHVIAAAFVYGREAITPSLFTPLVRQLRLKIPSKQKYQLKPLLYYLNRHIELDGAEHLPRAQQMLINLADDDAEKWKDIHLQARIALEARLRLLTAIQQKIQRVPKL